MVSFFGLRFGGDKKKSQGKQSDKKQPAQQQLQQQQQQPQQWKRIDQNILGDGVNFSRPKRPPSRPGTSQSTAARNSNWRATFKDIAATSSMVDLTAPGRRPSVSSLRQSPTEPNAVKPWTKSNASSASLVTPEPFGLNGVRPGIPGRPMGAKSEWVSPLDVHFGSEPPTPVAANGTSLRSPLSQFEFGHDDDSADFGEPGPAIVNGRTGYPSPPQSIDHEEQQSQFSPINPLGAVDRFGPASLPSPSPSAPRTSDEPSEPPVIQNVQAKRDTLTFLSPRRRSFAMEIEEADLEKHRQQQKPVEGFAGNFADFDFGNSAAKPAVACGTLGIELVESPIEMTEPNPFKEDQGGVIEDGMSEARATAPTKLPLQHSPPQPQQQYSPPQPVARPSGRALPFPSSRLVIPEPSESPRRDIRGPPPAAAGTPQESDINPFPRAPPTGFNSRLGSDSRPRGPPQPLRPAALSGLATQIKTATQTLRSPYGSPADINFLEAPRPPPDRPLPERPLPARPLPSPLASRTPLEGEFPVIKGLPRGRPLPRSPMAHDEAQREQEEESDGHCLPLWGGFGFDRSETRRSAMPAPLSPGGRQPSSPSWSSSPPSSATAPRIPSPTFPSLENAILSTSQDMARTFDISHDMPHPSPLVSEFSAYNPSASPGIRGNPMRIEAKRAPPRPAPFPLPPPSNRDRGPLTQDGTRSPRRPHIEVQTNFI